MNHHLKSWVGRSFVVLATAFGSHSSLAADLQMKAPVKAVPYVAAYDWSGFYAGGHIGRGWVDESATFLATNAVALDPAGTSYNIKHNGFLGGLQGGYDFQAKNWVLGVGGDFSWTDASVDLVTAGSLVAGSTIHTQAKTDWYATLTGRVGYAWDNVLVYGKGGAAWMHNVYGGFASVPGFGTAVYDNLTDTRTGWTVGAGLAWGFAPHWSVFGEYNYMDFGTKNYTLVSQATAITTNYDIKTTVSQAKFGLNYRF